MPELHLFGATSQRARDVDSMLASTSRVGERGSGEAHVLLHHSDCQMLMLDAPELQAQIEADKRDLSLRGGGGTRA